MRKEGFTRKREKANGREKRNIPPFIVMVCAGRPPTTSFVYLNACKVVGGSPSRTMTFFLMEFLFASVRLFALSRETFLLISAPPL
jgi:hypothetical protein